MKVILVKPLVLTLMVLWSVSALADQANVQYMTSLRNTDYHLLEPNSLDRRYHIYVRTPAEIKPGKRYPTVYLLDGGITFPLLASYTRYLTLAKDIPEMIVVGISYGTEDWRQGNMRSTDFTAPAKDRDHYGGAEAFQKVLVEELFPLIESRYPADPDQRILFGQSLGGQFVIYNAITRPELFSGLIASNPALHHNLEFFMEPKTERVSQTKLYVSMAEFDDKRFAEPAEQWVLACGRVGSLPFHMKVQRLAGHNHFSAAPDAFRNGLRWIF